MTTAFEAESVLKQSKLAMTPTKTIAQEQVPAVAAPERFRVRGGVDHGQDRLAREQRHASRLGASKLVTTQTCR